MISLPHNTSQSRLQSLILTPRSRSTGSYFSKLSRTAYTYVYIYIYRERVR